MFTNKIKSRRLLDRKLKQKNRSESFIYACFVSRVIFYAIIMPYYALRNRSRYTTYYRCYLTTSVVVDHLSYTHHRYIRIDDLHVE